jgi:hypothetical protein
MMPFIRVFIMKTDGDLVKHLKGEAPPPKRVIEREIVVNTDHISKIEVEYKIPAIGVVSVEEGLDNDDAIKRYKVFVAGEELNLLSDPDDPVMKIIQGIYDGAVKGREPSAEGEK